MKDSRYIIGIDLGTTNSAVSFIDTASVEVSHSMFGVPQVVRAGQVEEREVLPSFTYIPGAHELPEGSTSLPWDPAVAFCVGEFAREQGAKVPQRMISSAKSWLCHGGVDRNAAILPWMSPEEVEKMSPVEVSSRYLAHMKEAWNHSRDVSFEEQDIILTVPASFDAVARELTVKAAADAGLEVTLLEEPQAALYAWLEKRSEQWRKSLKLGDVILVCDIGGGTTDFSLISVQEEKGDLVLDRIAVGDHILLGGDNMDLALALSVQNRLKSEGTKLDTWQLQALCQSCRVAKEKILSDSSCEKHPILIAGRGSKLIGGAISGELDRLEVGEVIVDGFFPLVEPTDQPARGIRTGFAELGLPYESDPAVSKHIAKFITDHQKPLRKIREAGKDEFVTPSALLFNGGVLKSPFIQKRIIELLTHWAGDQQQIKILEAVDLDLAVAQGAAYYGMVKRGKGIRIRGGTARSYYIGIETSMPAVPGIKPPIKALCVAPQGMEEGTESELPDKDFGLVIGEPAEFRFLSSSTRPDDRVGTIVEDWDEGEVQELPSLKTTLKAEGKAGQLVPVKLRSHVTELGMLELWSVERDGKDRWKLEFDVREREDE